MGFQGFVLIRNNFSYSELPKVVGRGRTKPWENLKLYGLWSWPAPRGDQCYGEGTWFPLESNSALGLREKMALLPPPLPNDYGDPGN